MAPTEIRYEIYDKEIFAVIRAIQNWTAELQGLASPFIVYTDYRALEYFTIKRRLNARQVG